MRSCLASTSGNARPVNPPRRDAVAARRYHGVRARGVACGLGSLGITRPLRTKGPAAEEATLSTAGGVWFACFDRRDHEIGGRVERRRALRRWPRSARSACSVTHGRRRRRMNGRHAPGAVIARTEAYGDDEMERRSTHPSLYSPFPSSHTERLTVGGDVGSMRKPQCALRNGLPSGGVTVIM